MNFWQKLMLLKLVLKWLIYSEEKLGMRGSNGLLKLKIKATLSSKSWSMIRQSIPTWEPCVVWTSLHMISFLMPRTKKKEILGLTVISKPLFLITSLWAWLSKANFREPMRFSIKSSRLIRTTIRHGREKYKISSRSEILMRHKKLSLKLKNLPWKKRTKFNCVHSNRKFQTQRIKRSNLVRIYSILVHLLCTKTRLKPNPLAQKSSTKLKMRCFPLWVIWSGLCIRLWNPLNFLQRSFVEKKSQN